jgi:hypothetical protein
LLILRTQSTQFDIALDFFATRRKDLREVLKKSMTIPQIKGLGLDVSDPLKKLKDLSLLRISLGQI